VTLKWT